MVPSLAVARLSEQGPIDGDPLSVQVFWLAVLPALRLLAATQVPLPERKLGGGLVQVALGEEGPQPVPLPLGHLGAEPLAPGRQALVLVFGERAGLDLVAQEIADDAF